LARACILATRSSYWRWRWTMSRCTWPWGFEAALRMGFGVGALRRLDGGGWGGFLFLTTSTAASVLSIATWSAGAPRWLRSSGWAGATGPPRVCSLRGVRRLWTDDAPASVPDAPGTPAAVVLGLVLVLGHVLVGSPGRRPRRPEVSLSLSGSARLGRQTGTFGACRRRPWLNRILQVTNDVGTTLVVVVAVAHTPS